MRKMRGDIFREVEQANTSWIHDNFVGIATQFV